MYFRIDVTDMDLLLGNVSVTSGAITFPKMKYELNEEIGFCC